MAGESTTAIKQAERVDHQLVRGIGIPALTANIISSTIGAGIFVLPAAMSRKHSGRRRLLPSSAAQLPWCLFVTCFAIAGSRVSLTGGLYAYVEVAFGRYIGFLAGVLYGLTALGAVAGVVNVLVNSVALVVPLLASPIVRIVLMLARLRSLVGSTSVECVRRGAVTVMYGRKAFAHCCCSSAWEYFSFTRRIITGRLARQQSIGRRVILLIFAFVGIEVALIPSGEVKNPARTVPRSAYLALVTTTVVYILIQLVAQGTLGADSANTSDDAARRSRRKISGQLRSHGSVVGAAISAFGFVTSDILSSPRMLFAFGRDGALPSWFAHVQPRYRSPDIAIITYAVIAFVLCV